MVQPTLNNSRLAKRCTGSSRYPQNWQR